MSDTINFFVGHVHLKIPNISEYWLVSDALGGAKLLEEDAPKHYMVTQEGLEKFADRWKNIKAIVIDRTGKKYYSRLVEQQPSWAKINVKE